eukprot:12927439-Prorocentrum_lima.AAC.1
MAGTKMILEKIMPKDTKMPKKTMGMAKNGTTMGNGMAMIEKAKHMKSHFHPKKKRNNQILLQDRHCRS